MTYQPDLTILTPCKEPGRNLVQTLQSINSLVDHGIAVQHILLCTDPDGLGRIIPKCENEWRSIIINPDSGPYDALNHGVTLAKGRYVQVLNVGDIIAAPELLTNIGSQSCEVLSFGADDEYATCLSSLTTFQDLRFDSIGRHEAVLIRRDVMSRAPFDLELPIKADRDQMMTIGVLGGTIRSIPEKLVIVEAFGMSSHSIMLKEHENLEITLRHSDKLNTAIIGCALFLFRVTTLFLLYCLGFDRVIWRRRLKRMLCKTAQFLRRHPRPMHSPQCER